MNHSAVAAVATLSHLREVLNLVRSIEDCSGSTPVVLLLIDAPNNVQRGALARAIGVSQILVPDDLLCREDILDFRKRYTIAELCFSLKPFLLSRLLDEGYRNLLYLDADIRLYASIDGLFALLQDNSILLTPHLLDPLPDDSHLPNELTILRAGVFNAGFVGVSNHPEGVRFVRWWASKTRRLGYVDYQRGLGGDQKWCDLVPTLFDRVAILREPGLNVGYWNLPARPLSKRNGAWFVADEPLVFFHFSGFDPDSPDVLSKFQDRLDATAMPLLQELLENNATQLKQTNAQLASLLNELNARDPACPAPGIVELFGAGKTSSQPGMSGQTTAKPPMRAESLCEWMPFHGKPFLASVYQTLLLRDPDDLGREHFLRMIASGQLTRWEVAARIRLSREGRLRHRRVRGLWVGFALAVAYRVPVAGPVLAWLGDFLRIPHYLRDHSREDRQIAQLLASEL